MLSRVFLLFEENDMHMRYIREKKDFYKKAIPIIAVMMLILSVTLEVIYRIQHYGELTILTSCINWGCLVAFILLSFLVRYLWWTSWLICPILTCLTYYYFAFIDYERSSGITYFR